jgi:protein-export membrane protein SecD
MIPFTGDTAQEDAQRMALQLKTGGLEYKYEIQSAETVSATLGENTGLYIVIAIGAMVVLAIVLFAVKYKGFGLIAGLSLVFFILVETAMLIAVPGVVLSMAGVVGIILATALCVDGLIIIIKRISEEFENGKTVKAAVKTGFKRSLFPILNTNVLAVIIGLLLIAFTDGVIYGFAVTFSIGVAVSFITTVLIARMFTTLILPLLKNAENFLNFKRQGE